MGMSLSMPAECFIAIERDLAMNTLLALGEKLVQFTGFELCLTLGMMEGHDGSLDNLVRAGGLTRLSISSWNSGVTETFMFALFARQQRPYRAVPPV